MRINSKDLAGEYLARPEMTPGELDRFWRVAEQGLNPRIYQYLRLRFNLDGSVARTYTEIAKSEGVTPARVRQIVQSGIRLMQHPKRHKIILS